MFPLLDRQVDEIAMTGAVGPPSITGHKSAKMRDDTVVKLVGCDWHKQFKITVAVSTLNETWRAVRFGHIDSRPKLPVTRQICDGTGAPLGVPVPGGYFRSRSWTGGGAWSGF